MLRFSLFACFFLQFWIALGAAAPEKPVSNTAFDAPSHAVFSDTLRSVAAPDSTDFPVKSSGHDRSDILLELPEFMRSDTISLTSVAPTTAPHAPAPSPFMQPLLDGLKRPPRPAPQFS